jgi:hypothetical protein
LPLHAHAPGQRPVDPAEALASLLLSAGVAAQQIPPGLQARAARWRDYLAGKKVLLLLDDAASHEQVTPLLPGTAGSLVLVTSRWHLTALDEAAAISLEVLAPGEAAALLARLAHRPGLASDDGPAAREVTRLCGYLPPAIGMLARQLHHHPAWTPADLAAELGAAAGRLELMRAENLSVAAAFDLSYQDLTASQQRLFRRLGVHPGTDIDAYAAAALDGTDLATARGHLDSLYDHYLPAEPARGGTGCTTCSASTPARWRSPATRATPTLQPDGSWTTTCTPPPRPVSTSRPGPRRPADRCPAALRPSLRRCPRPRGRRPGWTPSGRTCTPRPATPLEARAGHAMAIPAAIRGFLFARGHWDQSAAPFQSALATALQAGDEAGQAVALNELGLL